MVRIAIAPNAFRGSLSAQEAAACIADGLHRSRLSCTPVLMPLADGGDGTLDTVLNAIGGQRITEIVRGPLGEPIVAAFGILAKDRQSAVIEMALASGLERLPVSERNPLLTTTYGTGQLIRAAIDRGCRRIYIGLGGSATNDGGAGCMQALGAKLLDADGRDLPAGGGALARLDRIDASALQDTIRGCTFVPLCDVTNPLTGAQGASAVFGPQKGADGVMVEQLDDALSHYAAIIARDLKRDVSHIPGGGAAGGFGAGLVAFTDAVLTSGAETLLALCGYLDTLATTNLLITGEGKLDSQTRGGKAVQIVAGHARRLNIPAFAFVGTLSMAPAELDVIGLSAAFSIVPGPCTITEAYATAAEWLADTAERFGNTIAALR